MTTTLKFWLSDSAILEALKNGQTLTKEQTVILPSDLPAEDYQVLATICGITNSTTNGNIITPQTKTVKWDGETFSGGVPNPSSSGLLQAIAHWRDWLNKQAQGQKEAKAKEEKQQRERAEKKAAEADANRPALANFLRGEDAYFEKERWLAGKNNPESYRLSRMALLDMFPDEETEIMAEIDRRDEASRIAALEAIAAESSAKNTLRQWAENHGSSLLKARIQEDMNWLELAKEEWTKANFPNMVTCDSVYNDNESATKQWRIQNATLTQIDQLRAFRQQHPQATDTHLWRVRLDDGSHQSYICGTFEGPLGKPLEMCLEIEDIQE